MRGFWNDSDGLTVAEVTILACLPLYLFVGVKMAFSGEIGANQVDFFSVLSYPIIAAIAKQAIERIGWPTLGRQGRVSPYQPPYPYGYYSPPPQQVYTPRDEGSGEEQASASNKPTI
ncbi:MAG: hypothetical protein K6U74_21345 [Firmicutes bacterium]|nr:hypothetical protein [Bacillota bacterium]